MEGVDDTKQAGWREGKQLQVTRNVVYVGERGGATAKMKMQKTISGLLLKLAYKFLRKLSLVL